MNPFNPKSISTITVLFFLLYSFPLQAEPYRPLQSLLIETELQSTGNGSAQDQTIKYRVDLDTTTPKAQLLNFYAADSREQILCRFTFHEDGSTTWQKTTNSLPQDIQQPILVNPGFPLPVDILPVATQSELEQVYEVQTSSGGRTFKNSYTVTITEVDFDVVLEKGWLRVMRTPDTEFRLFTVSNAQEKILAKQLWPVGGDWWLYEESPFRKSWRID